MSSHNPNECLADSSQTLPNEDETLLLPDPSRENMSANRHSSQTTVPTHRAAVFSVDALRAPPSISLLHIPPELIICVLLYLSPHDIISCRRTCRMLHDLCSYPELRYLVRMERCAVSDDGRPGFGYLERLRILENREEAWATLDFRRSVRVPVSFNSTSTYDFAGRSAVARHETRVPRRVRPIHSGVLLPFSSVALGSAGSKIGVEEVWPWNGDFGLCARGGRGRPDGGSDCVCVPCLCCLSPILTFQKHRGRSSSI